MWVSLAAFTAAAAVLTVTPGVDTALVLRSAAAHGARAGAAAALGVCAGLFVWGAGAALGLGALLATSPRAFLALKWAGAAYLLFVGLRLIFRPRAAFGAAGAASGGAGAALRRGFLTNVLNPKVGVFYATFLPQFIPAGADVARFSLLLAGIHAALALPWFGLLIGLTVPLGRWLRRAEVIRALDRLTGCVFVAFGARLLASAPKA
jgi:threonine/homoserine/homoserine lactone efflux protein